MKFNISEKKQLTLYTDFDVDIVELNDGFCAYRMNVLKKYMQETGRLEHQACDTSEGISEISMILGSSSEAELNDVLSWHKNFRPQMLVADTQFFADLKSESKNVALRGLHERVPQYNNFDFIKGYEGTLTVIYDDERLQCYTDVAGEPIPALTMLKIPGNEYDLEQVIGHLKGFDNVKPCEGEYQIETAPSGEQMVWINWLGSSDEMKVYLNRNYSYFLPYYVLNELLGLEPFKKSA